MSGKSPCDGCAYWRSISGSERDLRACHYCLDTGYPKRCRSWNCNHKKEGKADGQKDRRKL